MPSVSSRTGSLLVAAVVLAGLAGCLSPSTEEPRDPVDAAREAAAWIDGPREALAAGYEPGAACLPGEGVHWIDQDRIDTEIDPSRPEVLLFEPTTSDVADPDRQRLVGVEYVAVTEGTEHNTSSNPPTVAGRAMEGPLEGAPGEPWHATLHVFLDGREDPHAADDRARVPCPPGSLPPGMQRPAWPPTDGNGLVDAPRLPACEELGGERVHEHAIVSVRLNGSVVDLSPERYQLTTADVHVEGGPRDAEGAIVHVHRARPSLACFMATLGWQVSEGLVALDTGEVYRANATHRFTVLVDGERATEGFEVPLEGETRYQVLFEDTTRGAQT